MPSRHIEGKIGAHDRHQFELKLGYQLDPSLSKNKYNMELYMFIPKSLGINRATYAKRHFFGDIQSYIRFKTPFFTFDSLVDPSNKLSPLTRIKAVFNTTKDKKKLITELKLYACTVRVALRNSIIQMRKNIRKNETAPLKKDLNAACTGLTKCLDALRALQQSLWGPDVHEDVGTAYRHADEYIGIVSDGLLNSFHNTIIASNLDTNLANELSSIIKPLIISEFRHRSQLGYATYALGSENEQFLYRKSMLKKIITNILFLETHTLEGLTIAKDIIFAAAAGIAMIIFVVVSFWAGQKWRTTSMPFALALVLAYIVKDRFKDWFKIIFSRKMTRWFSDYKTNITDPATDTKIGICRHAFSFISEKNVPVDILDMRRHNTPPDFWPQEETIKYEKDVLLKPRPILKTHRRLHDITDIVRFNVHQFLDRMDESYEIKRAIDPETFETKEFKCARTYHVNIILKLENELHRFRLVLNQNGIKRIEEVPHPTLSIKDAGDTESLHFG